MRLASVGGWGVFIAGSWTSLVKKGGEIEGYTERNGKNSDLMLIKKRTTSAGARRIRSHSGWRSETLQFLDSEVVELRHERDGERRTKPMKGLKLY